MPVKARAWGSMTALTESDALALRSGVLPFSLSPTTTARAGGTPVSESLQDRIDAHGGDVVTMLRNAPTVLDGPQMGSPSQTRWLASAGECDGPPGDRANGRN